MAAACFFTIETFLARTTGTDEKHSAPAHMSTACAVDHKRTFHTTDTIPLPMLLPTAIRTMLSARWCARFAATLPPDSMLSRCSYSVVDAIHHQETGEGPIELVFRSPGSAFPARNRGFQARQGVTRWQSALGGRAWSIANPFPIRIVQINYCVLSSAAGSCRSACRAARLVSFSAACSCRNFVSCR